MNDEPKDPNYTDFGPTSSEKVWEVVKSIVFMVFAIGVVAGFLKLLFNN